MSVATEVEHTVEELKARNKALITEVLEAYP